MSFKASAPGRISFLGEHAVLYNYYTLVCAVNKRITVQLAPRTDKTIEILSELGAHQTHIGQIEIVPPFQFVLAALKQYQIILKQGCQITITSDFSSQIGIASSAAVTVAMLAVLNAWLDLNYSPIDMVLQGRRIVRTVQGFGSGADVAASVFGGMIGYRMRPLLIEPLPFVCPFTLVYSGQKALTTDVVDRVNHYFLSEPQLLKQLLKMIGLCSQQGIQAVRAADWPALGKLMDVQQGLMEALGVSTPLLNNLVNELRKFPGTLGAKISGAGMGDCVIGLGEYISDFPGRINVQCEPKGVQCEKN